MSTQLPSFFRTVIVVGLLLCIITWSSGLRYPVEIPTAVAQSLETPAISGINPEPPEHYLTFGLIPVAPTAVGAHDSDRDTGTIGGVGLMTLGGFIRYENALSPKNRLGAEFSAYGLGGALDAVVGLPGRTLEMSAPLVFRIAGGIRGVIPLIQDVVYFTIGVDMGVLIIHLPEQPNIDEEENGTEVYPAITATGVFIDPLTVGLEVALPDTTWTLGIRFESEYAVAWTNESEPEQYLLITIGRTSIFATTNF